MAAALLALAFLALVAIDLFRDQRVDLRPVLTHPRWLLVAPAAGALASALARDPFDLAALLCERFRLTENGIEGRGVLFAWHTLRLRRRRLFVDVRTTRGQRLRLPRWMDGLGTLTRMAGGITLR